MRSVVVSVAFLSLLCTACTPTGSGKKKSLVDSDAIAQDGTSTGFGLPDTLFQPGDAVAPMDIVSDPEVGKPPPSDNGSPVDPGPQPTDDGPPKDDGPDPPATPISGGGLVVEINSVEPPLQSATVTTKFRYGALPQPNASQTEGPCQVIYSNGKPTVDTTLGIDAGTITYSGLQQPMTLGPTQTAYGVEYLSGLPSNQSFIISGSTIGLSATGGQVPAFSVQANVPFPIQVSSPKAGGTVDKGNALTAVWNPGNGTHVRIDLFVIDGAEEEQLKGNTITCNIPGDVGSYTIPNHIMKQLPGGGKSGFPDFNFDYLVFGITRVVLVETALANGFGTVFLGVTRTGGGIAKLED